MERTCFLGLIFTPLFVYSPFLHAFDGNPSLWQQAPYLVKIETFHQSHFLPCSGTLIAQDWVLTAAHCVDRVRNSPQSIDLKFHHGEIYQAKEVFLHPAYDSNGEDIALIALNETQTQLQWLPLGLQTAHQDKFTLLGFAEYAQPREVQMKVLNDGIGKTAYSSDIELLDIGHGNTRLGDSGGAYVFDGQLVGVHQGIFSGNLSGAYGTPIAKSTNQNFILETIDGWHFPTQVYNQGEGKISIQNLHVTDEFPNVRLVGKVKIDESRSSCRNDIALAPFETCHWWLISQGHSGKFMLSETEVIQIN